MLGILPGNKEAVLTAPALCEAIEGLLPSIRNVDIRELLISLHTQARGSSTPVLGASGWLN